MLDDTRFMSRSPGFCTNRQTLFDEDERYLFFFKKSECPGGEGLTFEIGRGTRKFAPRM